MSDSVAAPATPSAPSSPSTAGGMLRQARQAQGLHIAALAAAIKVVPRKLELLESDQFDQLPDATFTRALAQTVCRTLKIDAAPVLALLPPPSGGRLEVVAQGLNTPFRERPGRLVPKEWATVASPAMWLAAVLIVAALAIYWMPAGWLPLGLPKTVLARAAAEPASAAASGVGAASGLAARLPGASPGLSADASGSPGQPVFPPGTVEAESAASSGVASVSPPVLQVRTTAPSWVEVTDARGQSLIARLVQPGENIGFDGALPMVVKIGNAGAAQVIVRGQPMELAAFTRDNVARLELK